MLARKVFILLLFISALTSLQAQNAGEIETSFNTLGAFNNPATKTITQPDGKIIVCGQFWKAFDHGAGGLARLNSDGTEDKTFQSPAYVNSYIKNIALQADGKIIVGGWFTSYGGSLHNYITRVNADGTEDPTFDEGTGFNSAGVDNVYIQPDGKIIVTGTFTAYNGVSNTGIVRLNEDGSIDTGFNTGTLAGNTVKNIHSVSNNKLILTGSFTSYNGTPVKYIVRLNDDGSIDNTFTTAIGVSNTINYSTILPDGKILVTGAITRYNITTVVNSIVRLNEDGTYDNTFAAPSSVNAVIMNPIDIDPVDGSIVIAAVDKIVKLDANGTLLSTFILTPSNYAGINYIKVQADQKILLAGQFTTIQGVARSCIAKLNTNGLLDLTFANLNSPGDYINDLALQPDDKVIIVGEFLYHGNVRRDKIARLNIDASVDISFDPGTGANGSIRKVSLHPETGQILIAGLFTQYNGTPRNGIALLNSDGSLDTNFDPGTGTTGNIYQIANQPDGKFLISGITQYNGVAVSQVIRLNVDGSIDNTFNFTYSNSILSFVNGLLALPDGKIMVGGNGTAAGARLLRLNADGSIDPTFNQGGTIAGNYGKIILLQDNSLLFIGSNIVYNGVSIPSGMVKTNYNGVRDNTFLWAGPSGDFAVQPDGSIVVAGSFSLFGPNKLDGLARCNPDGSIDRGFKLPLYGMRGYGGRVLIRPDGGILLSGTFDRFNEYRMNFLVVVNGRPSAYNLIKGITYTDKNDDCTPSLGETRRPYQMIKVMPGEYYGISDAHGNYEIRVDTGTFSYQVSEIKNSKHEYLPSICPATLTVNFQGAGKVSCCYNFSDSLKQCTLPVVQVQSSRRRRCFRGSTVVYYGNEGGGAMPAATVTVTYPSYITPISSVPAWTSKIGNVLTFDVGAIASDASRQITIIDSVWCGNEAIRGLTQCVKATISPTNTCQPVATGWDNSDIEITGTCLTNEIRFTIKNNGTGDMVSARNYRVYLNDVLIFTDVFLLEASESVDLFVNHGGATVRVEADQHSAYPGSSKPNLVIENCGTAQATPTLGYVMTNYADDDAPEVAYSCARIVDSYDPNEKLAMPEGTGSDNTIKVDQKIDYTIHFQNTGTDTAYTVVVTDTLDYNLDVSTLETGLSSHPYRLEVSGKGRSVLKFNFDNIMLPDSTTNRPGSNGYLKYSIYPKATLAPGQEIHNTANIYFDYNSAIITNTVLHTITDTEVTDFSLGYLVSLGLTTPAMPISVTEQIQLFPNPANGNINVQIKYGFTSGELKIVDVLGNTVYSHALQPSGNYLTLPELTFGFYTYQIVTDGNTVMGKLIIK